jgi:hypothetical protein
MNKGGYEPGELTSSHVATLLNNQDILQAEAQAVLRELDLLQLLAPTGTPTLIGSVALGLMVWRDIDIIVVSPGLTITQAFTILQPVLCHPRVSQVHYRNKSGTFNDTRQPQDARYFFAFHYQTEAGADWNIDVSFWLNDNPRHEIADLAPIACQITYETRLTILWLKEIWHRLPCYHGGTGKRAVSSRDIYVAVLQHGVRTPADFDAYLCERGKPARP